MDTLDALIDRRDGLRGRREDGESFGRLLAQIVEHPDAPRHPGFSEMLVDLAEWQANNARYDDAVEVFERAIDAGARSVPDPRCQLADYHLRAGREEVAAALFGDVRRDTPDDIWLYNAAGIAYLDAGREDVAVTWLEEGLELGMRGEDPDDLVAQMVDLRAEARRALGTDEPDELDRRVDAFLAARRAGLAQTSGLSAGNARSPWGEVKRPGQGVAAALAVFARGELQLALTRWPGLREEWDGVDDDSYLRTMEARADELRRHHVPMRGMVLVRVDPYETWARDLGLDPGEGSTRSQYAAEQLRNGSALPWPPGRNDPCWCASGKKYKRCCASG